MISRKNFTVFSFKSLELVVNLVKYSKRPYGYVRSSNYSYHGVPIQRVKLDK